MEPCNTGFLLESKAIQPYLIDSVVVLAELLVLEGVAVFVVVLALVVFLVVVVFLLVVFDVAGLVYL